MNDDKRRPGPHSSGNRRSRSRDGKRDQRDRDRDNSRNRRDRDRGYQNNSNKSGGDDIGRRRRDSRSRSRSRSPNGRSSNKSRGPSNKNLELFVGNILSRTNNSEMMNFLNSSMREIGLVGPSESPVVDFKLSNMFGFAVFDSIENCSKGLNLDGIPFHGSTLKLDRPLAYNGPTVPYKPWSEHQKVDLRSDVKKIEEFYMREIFIGNLPDNCKEDELVEFLGRALQVFGLSSSAENPVLSARFNGKYGFVELRTHEDAANLMNLNGIPLRNDKLRISRTTKYTGNDNGKYFNYDEINHSFKFGDLKLQTSGPISRVLCISNMVTIPELENAVLCAEMLQEARAKFSSYGHVIGVVAPRPNDGPNAVKGVGKVFVMMETEAQAITALQDMKGGTFDGRIVDIKFYPEPMFSSMNYNFEHPLRVLTRNGQAFLKDVVPESVWRIITGASS